jgi:membrane associated rhomboid family serine protease
VPAFIVISFIGVLALYFVAGIASLAGPFAVTGLGYLIAIGFFGAIGYIIIGAILAPFAEAKERKRWARELEERRRRFTTG